MKVFKLKTQDETRALAVFLSENIKNGDVIAFRGGMGVGKTTLCRYLVSAIGIDAPVSSPTFALVNEYRSADKSVYHFDMYRISGYDDLESTGFFDYLDGKSILLIEWSENISDELPKNTIFITIEKDEVDENTRTVTIEGGKF